MNSQSLQSLWNHLRSLWLAGAAPVWDPRLAADAGRAPIPQPRYLSPLVGAWLH
jgi:hypothetical protein